MLDLVLLHAHDGNDSKTVESRWINEVEDVHDENVAKVRALLVNNLTLPFGL